MATPTLEDLLSPQTEDDTLATLLQRLAGKGFPVTTWQVGSIARTLLQLFARGLSDASALLVAIAKGGFAALATGDWLTLVAKQVYGLDRNPALYAEGSCQLAAAASSSGYTITAGQLVAISSGGLRYFNTSGGVLAAGETLDVTFRAESPGSAYSNVSAGSISKLGTPLPGVTISNPDLGSGTWITSVGTDTESDDSLKARCAARWPSLADVPTIDVFDLWAKAASDQVGRTLAKTDSSVPGQVDLYLAGASGAITDPAVAAAVQAYVDARILLTSTCVVASATAEPIQLDATLYVRAGYETTALAAAQAASEAYISGVDINGTVYESDAVAALQNPSGVRNVTLQVLARESIGSGVGDVDLSAIAGGPYVATPVVNLTVVTV